MVKKPMMSLAVNQAEVFWEMEWGCWLSEQPELESGLG